MPTPVRPEGVKPVVLSLDRGALAILHALAPTHKSHGHYLSGLLRAELARIEERVKLGYSYADIARLYGLPVQDAAVPEPRTRLARQAGVAVDADIAMVYGLPMEHVAVLEE